MPTFTIRGESRLGGGDRERTDDVVMVMRLTMTALRPEAFYTRLWEVLDEDGLDVTPLIQAMIAAEVPPYIADEVYENNIDYYRERVSERIKERAQNEEMIAAFTAALHSGGFEADLVAYLDTMNTSRDSVEAGESPPVPEETAD